jgi:hypothetical protein
MRGGQLPERTQVYKDTRMFENKGQKTEIRDLAAKIVLAEERIKQLKKDVLVDREHIILLLQQSGQYNGGYDNGLSPRLETQLKIGKRGSIEECDLHQWLAEHDLADIIKPFVHAGTLQSTLVKFIDAGNELPPEIFNQFEKTVVKFGGRTKFVAKNSRIQEPQNTGI